MIQIAHAQFFEAGKPQKGEEEGPLAQVKKTAKLITVVSLGVLAFASTPPLFVAGVAFGALLSSRINETGDRIGNYLKKTWHVATGGAGEGEKVFTRVTAWLKISLFSMALFCSLPAMWEFFIFSGAAYFTAKELKIRE